MILACVKSWRLPASPGLEGFRIQQHTPTIQRSVLLFMCSIQSLLFEGYAAWQISKPTYRMHDILTNLDIDFPQKEP
jgi:hypothetical protein